MSDFWFQQYVVLKQVAHDRSDFWLAGLALLDAAAGFTTYLAARFKIKDQEDAVLAWMLLLAYLIFQRQYSFQPNILLIYDHVEFHAVLEVIDGLSFASVIVCSFLARRMGRSFFLWLLVGFLGNVGAIAWLLIRRGKTVGRMPDGSHRFAAQD